MSGKKRWTKSEMVFVQNGMTKNLGRNFVCFSIMEFLGKNCDKKLHHQQRKKYTNYCLLVQTLHTTKRKKNKKRVLFVCKHRAYTAILRRMSKGKVSATVLPSQDGSNQECTCDKTNKARPCACEDEKGI